MPESPFLQIPEAEYICSNKLAFAVWDKFPVTTGHALIIPYRIMTTWWETSQKEKKELSKLLEQTRQIIEEKYNPDGFNIGINNNKAAGQTVSHLHIHLIPRYLGDTPDPRGGVRHVIPSKGNYLELK